MKQPKRLTRDQKELLAIAGENPKEWLCEIQDQYISVFVKKNAPEEKITANCYLQQQQDA